MNFGEKIYWLMARLNLTTQATADILGVDSSTVRSYKAKPHTQASPDKALRLVKFAQANGVPVTLDWLFDPEYPVPGPNETVRELAKPYAPDASLLSLCTLARELSIVLARSYRSIKDSKSQPAIDSARADLAPLTQTADLFSTQANREPYTTTSSEIRRFLLSCAEILN